MFAAYLKPFGVKANHFESMTPQQKAFQAVCKTLKNNRVMIFTKEDGIYIRLAGKEESGEAFTLHQANVFPFDERRDEQSNTFKYAERELSILSKSATDPDNRPIIEPFSKEILALCDKFGKAGESGGSAPYTATAISQAIKKLLLQEPICDITGIKDEWVFIRDASEDDKMMFQNNRCSALFMDDKSNCWYLDAIAWKTQNGGTWSGSAILPDGSKLYSRQYIKSFPFRPKTFYIDVIEKEVAKDDWEFYIKAPRQLNRVFKYYLKK